MGITTNPLFRNPKKEIRNPGPKTAKIDNGKEDRAMKNLPRTLTEQDKQEIIENHLSPEPPKPVRFMWNGQNFNPVTGDILPKGTNIMHQVVFWGLSPKTALEIARRTGTKAVFSGGKEN